MFKRILVPLDGSARAERALPVAARLARASSGTVILVRVVDTSPETFPSAPAKPNLAQTVGPVDLDLAESYLEGVAKSGYLTDIPVKTVANAGLIAPTILSVAATRLADVIVMCSHGLTGAKRWMMGSVSEKVAEYSDIPVLVLREGGPLLTERGTGETKPLRILVPLDGSVYAQAAVVPAANLTAALADPEQRILHLIHIVKVPTEAKTPAAKVAARAVRAVTVTHEPQAQVDIDLARQYLNEMISRISDSVPEIAELNIKLTGSVFADADVAHAIVRVAEHGEGTDGSRGDGRCDAIAMTTHGNSGQQRWAMGNITGRVLHATRLPMLIVRPRD